MGRSLLLNEITEDKIDTVLSLNETGKTIFFDSLISEHYPHIEKTSNEYNYLQLNYRSCWMMEKIYRNSPGPRQATRDAHEPQPTKQRKNVGYAHTHSGKHVADCGLRRTLRGCNVPDDAQ